MTSRHDQYADPEYEYRSSNIAGSRRYKANPDRCRWNVMRYIGSWPHPGQCEFKHKPDSLWCGVHNPEAMAKRQKKKDTEDDAAWQARRKEIYATHFYAALQRIAKPGLNDPAGYAQTILDEFHERNT